MRKPPYPCAQALVVLSLPQERVRKLPVWFSPFFLVLALSPALLTCFVATTAMAAPNETCEGHCGGQSPAGCWCDDQCTQYGDCCADYEQWCVSTGETCEGYCGGQSPTGCWCDDQCTQYGDCCADYEQWCVSTGETCEGYCGGKSPDGCWCDDQCTQYGDCCADYEQWCVQSVFPCTEQGIRDAIAAGGGPHYFDCDGPTAVTTQDEIFIYNDVILDGEGNLTIDGNDDHRVLSVVPGITAELVGMTVSGGRVNYEMDGSAQGGGILNQGTLTITDSSIENNGALGYTSGISAEGGGIYNSGTLSVQSSFIRYNYAISYSPQRGAGISGTGTITLANTQVSNNGGPDGSAIFASANLTVKNSTVTSEEPPRNYLGIVVNDGSSYVINSTIIGGWDGPFFFTGTLTLISSTVVNDKPGRHTIAMGSDATLTVANSLIIGPVDQSVGRATCTGESVISLGGNVESPTNDCALTDPTDLVNVAAQDLNLGPLADNGGPTMTHALLPGSVAIDRIPTAMCVDADGQPLTTDQRGVARPQGAMCDVGAFELEAGLCGGFTTGACEDPSLSCQCCPIGGPAQSCLCSTPCNSDAECTDPSRTTCNRPDFVGSTGFCAPAEFTCCWLCV